jgi:hypothetical protein
MQLLRLMHPSVLVSPANSFIYFHVMFVSWVNRVALESWWLLGFYLTHPLELSVEWSRTRTTVWIHVYINSSPVSFAFSLQHIFRPAGPELKITTTTTVNCHRFRQLLASLKDLGRPSAAEGLFMDLLVWSSETRRGFD